MSRSETEPQTCCFCRLPRAEMDCEVCKEPVCRSCVQRLSEDSFNMLSKKPAILSHDKYCPRCHDEHIEPARASYDETLERAKQVHFWPRTYRGHIPVIAKGRAELVVEGGNDRDEVLLKLGFMAAELGYNGLIKGELVSRKWRDEGYQKMQWTGRGFPVTVDEGKLERAEFREAHWRVLHHR